MLGNLFFVTLAFAKPPGCPAPANPVVKRSIPVPSGASFFLRAAPDTREVAFATGDRTASRVIDLDNPKNERMVDGDFDPVPTADGDLLTVPQSIYMNFRTGKREFDRGKARVEYDYVLAKEGGLLPPIGTAPVDVTLEEAKARGKTVRMGSALTFYARDRNRDFSIAYIDQKHNGSYQSVGTLARNAERANYRVLLSTGQDFRIRDYHYDRQTKEISPTGEARVACRAASGVTGSMPVLAPDGRSMSFYDLQSQSTRVLAIGDNGACSQVESIPAMVGKPSFSPDGRLMAFHVDRGPNKHLEPAWPSAGDKLGVWILDRQTKRLIPIVVPESGNDYYPVFLSNNEIAYMHSTGGEGLTIDIADINLRAGGVACRECDDTDRRRFAAAVLGAMYNAHCEGPPLVMENAIVGLSDLTPQTCRAFVGSLKESDIADEPSLAGLKVTSDRPTESVFAKVVRRTRRIFESQPERTRRKAIKFESRRAPKHLVIDDLLDICGRLTVERPAGLDSPSAQ